MNPFARVLHHSYFNRNWLWLVAFVLATGSGKEITAQTASSTPIYRWTTLAGSATTGFADGLAQNARFNNPRGIAVDADDNVYVADTANHTIRKISAQGIVTTLAGNPGQPGSADGSGTEARFSFPGDVAVDASGNVYVADTENYTLRKITPQGTVSTLAGKAGERDEVDGPGNVARFTYPTKISTDNLGNIYVQDSKLRRITPSGIVEPVSFNLNDAVFAKDGQPAGKVLIHNATTDADGNLYFCIKLNSATVSVGYGSYDIRRIAKLSIDGVYSILASSYSNDSKPYLSDSVSVTTMSTARDGTLYYATRLNSSVLVHQVYKITPEGDLQSALWRNASRGGDADAPLDLAIDSHGKVLHTAASDDVIFKTTANSLDVLAGTLWSNLGADGTGPTARFARITALSVDGNSHLLVGDSQSSYFVHHRGWAAIRRVSDNGETTTLYSSPSSERTPVSAEGIIRDSANNVVMGLYHGGSPEITELAPDRTTRNLPVGNIRRITAMDISLDGRMLVAERQRVHRRDASGEWSVLAGSDGTPEIKDGVGASARFSNIQSMAVTPNGNIYVLDAESTASAAPHKIVIRQINPSYEVTTVSNNLVQHTDTRPYKIALDINGDFLLTYSDDTIRLLTVGGVEHIVGGQPNLSGARDGDATQALFYQPWSITTDASNNIYISDNTGTTLRKGEFLGVGPSITNHPQSLSIAAGTTAQFTVTTSGTPEPTYQWQFNGNAINGATKSTLSLTNTRSSDSGDYTVIVTNSLGSVTSNIAKLTVTTASRPSTPSSSGGGGGGGAPSTWFVGVMTTLILARWLARRRLT